MSTRFRTVTAYPNYGETVVALKKGFEVIDITRHFYPPTVVVTEPSTTEMVQVAFKVVSVYQAVEEDGYRAIGAEHFQKELCVVLMKVLD